jgi:hypothetical protein
MKMLYDTIDRVEALPDFCKEIESSFDSAKNSLTNLMG